MENNNFSYSAAVREAIDAGRPVLALESTIIAHGMPYPENLVFAREAEARALAFGAEPATIAILGGKICIGLEDEQLEQLASDKSVVKVATREIGLTLAREGNGATTVSATMRLAHATGIPVFATGGIGGVHRDAENSFDVSADLIELSRTPVIVVSAGAKAILDLPKTLEYLETMSVPVIGYQTDEFPAFYSRSSGINLSAKANHPKEIAVNYNEQLRLGIMSGILVANPVPKEFDIPLEIMNKHIELALGEAKSKGIDGKELTPFLLGRIVELSDGQSLVTNRALALNNVQLGAEIAMQLSELT